MSKVKQQFQAALIISKDFLTVCTNISDSQLLIGLLVIFFVS